MFRARVVFNGSLDNRYPWYSTAKETEQEVRDMLTDMKPVLVYADSVQLQESFEPLGSVSVAMRTIGWKMVPAFNDDWSQRIG